MKLFALEEFAAKRRTAQTDLEDALRDDVQRAVDLGMNTHGWQELLTTASHVYAETYEDEAGQPTRGMPPKFRERLLKTLQKTKVRDENTVERITVWLATAILTQATRESANDDPEELFLEWVTMGDPNVRHAHAAVSGQTRPIGEPFNVGGYEMDGPGDPTVPIELWINCRCTIRPVLATEVLTAAMEFISEKPWDGSAGRFTPEQWRSSCILHLADTLNKSDHKLPIKEPGGQLSRAGVHAAASRFGSVQAPPEAKAKAKASLRGAYKQLGEEPPPAIKAANEGIEMTDTTTEEPIDPDFETPDQEADAPVDDISVAWHGVLAPEGIPSGDGRMFSEGSLTTRPLPLPLTWQKISADGHNGNVTIAKIDKIERVGNEMRASGMMLATPEADELVGLVSEFGKFGVSVDADMAEMELNDEQEQVVFTAARIASACVVPIPAFAEAWVALGEAPEDFFPGGDAEIEVDDSEAPDIQDEALVASLARMRANAVFVKTEDGPGWLTHPVDTDRLRDYWVRGPGAAKIGWGTPGDFNRCRLQVAKYVKPQYLNGYCANRHYDALGFWPGRPVSGDTVPFAADAMGLEDTQPAEAVSLVSSIGHVAPAAWFKDPELTTATALTITDEGEVYGHMAEWGVCHIGIKGICREAPHSATDYAYFRTGQVALDDGTRVSTGPLTIGGGHAPGPMGLRAAVEHYDRTSNVFADVACGEDSIGIWFHGWVRPGTTKDMITAAMASGVSGDWRAPRPGAELELVACLAVNTSGFPVLRPKVAASNGNQVSLVAAGAIQPHHEERSQPLIDTSAIAAEVVAMLSRRDKLAALAARVNGAH